MIVLDHCGAISPFPWLVVGFWLSLPGLPPSSTGARTERPGNPLTPASYRPGLFLAIDNNQGKEKPMSKLADPIHALALSATIDVLRGILGEATDYLDQGEHLAALGTLIPFDDHAEDVKAAIRLFRRDIQADGRRK